MAVPGVPLLPLHCQVPHLVLVEQEPLVHSAAVRHVVAALPAQPQRSFQGARTLLSRCFRSRRRRHVACVR